MSALCLPSSQVAARLDMRCLIGAQLPAGNKLAIRCGDHVEPGSQIIVVDDGNTTKRTCYPAYVRVHYMISQRLLELLHVFRIIVAADAKILCMFVLTL